MASDRKIEMVASSKVVVNTLIVGGGHAGKLLLEVSYAAIRNRFMCPMRTKVRSTRSMSSNIVRRVGGHTGVNLACMLELAASQQQTKKKASTRDYLILERANSLLSKWRDKRWDHFQLNTPLMLSTLHGQTIPSDRDPWLLDRPLSQDIQGWDEHIEKLGILSHTKLNSLVVSVTPSKDGDGTFDTLVKEADGSNTVYQSKNVVACNGFLDHNIVPSALAEKIPSFVKQHTTGGFRLEDLVPGNILVVGSSQSGIQISQIFVDKFGGCDDDSSSSGRKVFLACSAAGGCPRSFRGHDLFYWLHRNKFIYIPREALVDMPPEKRNALRYNAEAGSPVTGPNRAISPFSLERQGVTLVGRFNDVSSSDDGKQVHLKFKDDLCDSLKAAKEGHNKITSMIRDFASKLEAESDETFPPETPEKEWEITNESLLTDPGILSLDLKESGITNVVWAVGWANDLAWLKIDKDPTTNDDFDQRTKLPDRIVSQKYPGLFFAGYPWVGTIQSMNIAAMDTDAKVIVANLKD